MYSKTCIPPLEEGQQDLSRSTDTLHEARPDFAHLAEIVSELHLIEKEGDEEILLHAPLQHEMAAVPEHRNDDQGLEELSTFEA